MPFIEALRQLSFSLGIAVFFPFLYPHFMVANICFGVTTYKSSETCVVSHGLYLFLSEQLDDRLGYTSALPFLLC